MAKDSVSPVGITTTMGVSISMSPTTQRPIFSTAMLGTGVLWTSVPFAGTAYNEHGVAEGGMGVDFGDYNNDGSLDIFVTNFSNETNTLYHNTADGALIDFTNIAGLGGNQFPKIGVRNKVLRCKQRWHIRHLRRQRPPLSDGIRRARIRTNRPVFHQHRRGNLHGCLPSNPASISQLKEWDAVPPLAITITMATPTFLS